jgi:hypothetical protein
VAWSYLSHFVQGRMCISIFLPATQQQQTSIVNALATHGCFLDFCIQVESRFLLREEYGMYHHLEEEVECKLSRSYILSTRDTTKNQEPYQNALTAP